MNTLKSLTVALTAFIMVVTVNVTTANDNPVGNIDGLNPFLPLVEIEQQESDNFLPGINIFTRKQCVNGVCYTPGTISNYNYSQPVPYITSYPQATTILTETINETPSKPTTDNADMVTQSWNDSLSSSGSTGNGSTGNRIVTYSAPIVTYAAPTYPIATATYTTCNRCGKVRSYGSTGMTYSYGSNGGYATGMVAGTYRITSTGQHLIRDHGIPASQVSAMSPVQQETLHNQLHNGGSMGVSSSSGYRWFRPFRNMRIRRARIFNARWR